MKNGDFPMKNGDFPMKNGDFPMKNGDFPISFLYVHQAGYINPVPSVPRSPIFETTRRRCSSGAAEPSTTGLGFLPQQAVKRDELFVLLCHVMVC